MQKPLSLALASILLLTGCGINTAVAKMDPQQDSTNHTKVNLHEEQIKYTGVKKEADFQPRGVISTTPINYDSTYTTISTTEIWDNAPEIRYHIWRTADGKESMKEFSSTDIGTNYSFRFDTKEFMSQRGEYQVEAYKVKADGKEGLIAQTTVTLQQHVPILMYHAIYDYRGSGFKELFVTPANFGKQMLYLKGNGFNLLTFERWEEVNKVNKPIFVTFDDGMKNNLNAFHILQNLQDDRFKPTATEYVIAGTIDSDPGMLSSAEIREMVDSGIFSAQAHTMSHADLPKSTNFEVELGKAKETIEQVTGKPVIAIAYPFGKYDSTVVQESKKYYRFATTIKPGQFIEKGQEDEFLEMQRVRISYSTTLNQFAALVK